MSNPILKYNHNDNRLADCIRILTMDAVFNVKSGHHGMPMGMADFMTVLFKYFFNFNPNKPYWNNRDRKFTAQCNNPITKGREGCGYFDCPEKAHASWKRRKHEIACQLAELQTDQRVSKALRSRYL